MYTMKYVKEHKQAIILVALAVFIVAEIIIFGVLDFGERDGIFSRIPADVTQEGDEEDVEVLPPTYTSDVPKDAQLDEPETEVPAAPGTDETLGIFNIKVSKDGYEPSTLTVKKGNLIQINLTAVDGDFDFSMPYKSLYQFVKKGETKQVSFGVKTSGTYNFMCRDYCPGNKVIEGKLIVIP